MTTRTVVKEPEEKKICPKCKTEIKRVPDGNGFGAGTKEICECPDPFVRSSSSTGWGKR